MSNDELKHVRGGLTRRHFLQGLAVGTLVASGLAGCAPKEQEKAADTLDKVLFELSSQMKNAYSRSDA